MNMHVWKCQQTFMLVKNAVVTLQTSKKSRIIAWSVWKSTVMHRIGNSGSIHTHKHMQLLLQIKTNQQPGITTELSSAIYESMAKINCLETLHLIVWNLFLFLYTPSATWTVLFPVFKVSALTMCTNNVSLFLFGINIHVFQMSWSSNLFVALPLYARRNRWPRQLQIFIHLN